MLYFLYLLCVLPRNAVSCELVPFVVNFFEICIQQDFDADEKDSLPSPKRNTINIFEG
jgi:hypothetical protein